MNKAKRIIVTNAIVSSLSQMVILLLGFVVPRIVMTHYGSDTNGLITTITQIFTYMALLEAGISQASRNKLYKPIKDDDKEEISFWVSASRNNYRRLSLIYFLIVIVLAFALPLLLKTNVDYFSIAFYVFFEGMTNVISFFFLNSWICFLNASGKTYITNIFSLITKVLGYGIRIVLALLGVNIALIQVGYFIVSMIQLFIYFIYMKKNFGWINYGKAPPNTKLPDRNAYIVGEVAWTIFSSTDMIVLSIFLSTNISSVYSVYNMVFYALNCILNTIYSSLVYILGITYEKNKNDYIIVHDLFNSVFIGGITVLMSTCYLLIIPFIKLYTAGITDVNYIYANLPLLFSIVQILSWSRYVSGNLIGIAGLMKKVTKINIIEALSNVLLSVVLVNVFGINGVLLATVLALPLKAIYCNYYADKVILKRNPIKTIFIFLTNYISFFIIVVIQKFFVLSISSVLSFFIYGIVIFTILFVAIGILNILANRDLLKMFKYLKKGQ